MLQMSTVLMQATPELSDLIKAYRAAKADLKAATERSDQLKGMLKAVLEPSLSETATTVELLDGEIKVTLKAVTTKRLDTARIKIDRPDIYAYYLKESVTYTLTDGLS